MEFEENVKLQIEDMHEQDIIYARRIGPYGIENHKLMETFKSWVRERGLLTDEAIILGIALDDPSMTNPEKCRYDVCLIGNLTKNDPWVSERKLFGGKYAVLEMPHTVEMLGAAWQKGFAYVMKQGLVLDSSRPVIERYVKNKVDMGLCEFCMPIAEL